MKKKKIKMVSEIIFSGNQWLFKNMRFEYILVKQSGKMGNQPGNNIFIFA